jgi:hypothetical protein
MCQHVFQIRFKHPLPCSYEYDNMISIITLISSKRFLTANIEEQSSCKQNESVLVYGRKYVFSMRTGCEMCLSL